MLDEPIYDRANPIHRKALELFGEYVNCGFVVCGQRRDYETAYINDTFPRYLGYTREEFTAKFPFYIDCVHPEDRAFVQNAIESALSESDQYDLIYRVVRKDGGVVWIRENGKRVRDAGGEALLVCLLVDITADMAIRREIERQSQTDALTSCLNRAAFIDLMKKLLAETPSGARNHALIMMDLDHFKSINDTMGHACGDRVLEGTVGRLKELIRAGDLLGRLGGDEFMLCLKNIASEDAIDRRIVHFCQQLRQLRPAGVDITCSMGVAFYPRDGQAFAPLYRHADIALYAAKRAGRDRYTYYAPDMDESGFLPNDTPIEDLESAAR